MKSAQKRQLATWLHQFTNYKSHDPIKMLQKNPELAAKILDEFPAVTAVVFPGEFFSVGTLRADQTRIAQAHVVHDSMVEVVV